MPNVTNREREACTNRLIKSMLEKFIELWSVRVMIKVVSFILRMKVFGSLFSGPIDKIGVTHTATLIEDKGGNWRGWPRLDSY